MNKNLKEQIIQLRESGLSYDKIAEQLSCSKSTISYHVGQGQKEKFAVRRKKSRNNQHPYVRKIENFQIETTPASSKPPTHHTQKLLALKIQTFSRIHGDMSYQKPQFTVQDVIDKFGEHPTCYLTGEPIDINKPRTYHFDHRIPRSRGGDNSLDNLELCSSKANQAKGDMTVDELTMLCKSILEQQGYRVDKP